MKFGIDIGHNCPPDTGAVGVEKEDKLTKAVGTFLMQKLAAAGHSVINCTPTTAVTVGESLRKRVEKANSNNVDVFVSIHFNAFNGQANGTEVFAISNTSKAIARSVLNEIVKLGFKNKGVKSTPFFVIKNTSMPAILVECCFCDSKADMDRFNAEKMAEAIKDGLIGDTDTDEPKPAEGKKYLLKVTQKTVLKPSTEQSSEIPKEALVDIEPGEYPILDFRYEEKHYWVKWVDKSQADRDEHFIFDAYGKVVEET
ncbi:N-acetylmuramoyl-L-alanine amidase [Fischerella thermalis]|uniref:N-acetylmuramoyl-L-alanine amidase n=1 Tax=Fischerella thermalis CCMEE 5318 TaxID=2019666 RepID=A0A2N6LLF8_9CYAN|nr:N-acetylmuramoyl-L-alanine amidase [Fischerella thermalis]PMB25853.1 N-acetylmuramoyl-L-alanine amidase [Fischerella thermalis CCMEE 5318]PMB39327.1 N-acetylmuramoyl-L-alanine amidase [Fischerella thermalis CCMEE 5319]